MGELDIRRWVPTVRAAEARAPHGQRADASMADREALAEQSLNPGRELTMGDTFSNDPVDPGLWAAGVHAMQGHAARRQAARATLLCI
jgi:hypothetical protein